MRKNKWKNRDKKIHKKKHGMRVDGKSVFLLAQVWTGKKKRKKPNSLDKTKGIV